MPLQNRSLNIRKIPHFVTYLGGEVSHTPHRSAHTFCVSPGRSVGAFLHVSQNRAEGQFSAPKPVTKWGKVLISLNPFCKRYALRASRQPYPVQTRFPKLDFLLRANRRETADKRPALASAEITGIPSARTNLHARAHDRGSVLKLGTHLRKPFLVQTRFPTLRLFAARVS